MMVELQVATVLLSGSLNSMVPKWTAMRDALITRFTEYAIFVLLSELIANICRS
jgi:hypothetical protein